MMRLPPVARALLASAALVSPPPAPRAAEAAPPQPVLTLAEAVRSARARQPALQQAQADTAAAAARAEQARAPLLPQLDASGAYRRFTSNGPGAALGGSPGSSTDTSGSWSFGAKATQLVWDFGQGTGRWRAAREGATAQAETEAATGLQVLFAVRSAFFAARAARDLVAVARETLANQEAHLGQIQGFVEVGTRPEIDLAQARTDRANAQVQRINAENGYEVAKAQLNQAMGVEGPTAYDVADDVLAALPGEDRPVEELLAEAMARRPEVASLGSQVRARQASLGAVKGAYLPSLGVSTEVTDTGATLGTTFWNWSAAATLTWNLYQGGLTRAQEQEARAALQGIDAQVAALRQQVRLEVEQARLAVRAGKAALEAAGEALLNARQRLRLAEGRYQTGSGSAIEQGDAQLALTAAAAQKVTADYNLATSRAQLLRALGREPEGPVR